MHGSLSMHLASFITQRPRNKGDVFNAHVLLHIIMLPVITVEEGGAVELSFLQLHGSGPGQATHMYMCTPVVCEVYSIFSKLKIMRTCVHVYIARGQKYLEPRVVSKREPDAAHLARQAPPAFACAPWSICAGTFAMAQHQRAPFPPPPPCCVVR